MREAPFHAALADGPAQGHAVWVQTGDGVRIRLGIWPEGERGTVLLFPGRSEYVEKYGRAAADLRARGYATITLDWRGQGLADHALSDPMTGHIGDFDEYQRDVDAMLAARATLSLPEPLFLLAHSMGGNIGLRSAMRRLDFRAVAFTAPMWGIPLGAAMRPFALAIARGACCIGQGHRYAPGTGPANYTTIAAFEGNSLTTDPDMWAYMQGQVQRAPALALAGRACHGSQPHSANAGRWPPCPRRRCPRSPRSARQSRSWTPPDPCPHGGLDRRQARPDRGRAA